MGKADPPRGEDWITVYDERGREVRIQRDTWKNEVLPANIKKAWNDADALYGQIVHGLHDGFAKEVVPAAKRLVKLDSGSERSHVVLAICRLKLGKPRAAERELRKCIDQHGESAIVLTNLAKVYAETGQEERSTSTLRRALELDPNQDNALLWWAAIARERGGVEEHEKALAGIARLPGAWRPQLVIARAHLGRRELAQALELYRHVLSIAADEPDVLVMVSGDLGNAGALTELVNLVAPHYVPERHGPLPGLNLAEALKQLGRTEEALAMVRRLQALGLSPFAARLSKLEYEIATSAPARTDAEPPTIVAAPVVGVLWTGGLYDPDWLLPERGGALPSLTFVALANERTTADAPQRQAADRAGRTTRAVPAYLAEQFLMHYAVSTTFMLLVVQGVGPVVSGKAADFPEIEPLAAEQGSPRIVVGGALTPRGVTLEAWNAGSSQKLASIQVDAVDDDGALASALYDGLCRALEPTGLLRPATPPGYYADAPAEIRRGYASALDQLTYQLLAAAQLVPASSLWNERGFFETYFDLAERWPGTPVNAQLIAIAGVAAATQYGSNAVAPYRKPVLDWLARAPADGVLARLAPAVYKRLGEPERLEQSLARARTITDTRYAAWLARVTR